MKKETCKSCCYKYKEGIEHKCCLVPDKFVAESETCKDYKNDKEKEA